ncbi:Druantia anti-phage system protein DruA [Paenibacillus cymbidii]|uniref:Druantia anti-phage system protein DruA n=1 Tax=Paenibacillus cymbidii TaxID=1639034 RepID=UPI001A9A81F0|nr:Druantia anti-phage system protein DruA [Paenibacillus cymbidii]
MIRKLMHDHPSALRVAISRQVCLAWQWFKPDGGLKDMSCRVLLLKLHRLGAIELPPPQKGNSNGKKFTTRTPDAEPQETIGVSPGLLRTLTLVRIDNKRDSLLWNEFMARYHYLGYTPLPGAQIRYFIQSAQGLLGAIGFSAAAWKVQPRDSWIAWPAEVRKKQLHFIVNNSRFLIFPWVHVKNLASRILSMCAKQLPGDWQRTYGYTRPFLWRLSLKRTALQALVTKPPTGLGLA